MKLPVLGLIAVLCAVAGPVSAHPVTYKDNVAVMSFNQPFLYDIWGVYSFRSDMAVVARVMRMDMPEGDSYFYAPQFDWLVKRWNGADYQANIYAYGAFGGVNFSGENGIGGLAGVEADAESRRWYVLAKWESMWTNTGPDFHQAVGRVGIAPYEADINDLATWLMFQAQYHPSLTRDLVLTPVLRLLYRNFMVEAGASIKGDWLVNGMVHF